ncbi:uncharacterized protein LOC144341652 [Saccoglossus kowalevskii]
MFFNRTRMLSIMIYILIGFVSGTVIRHDEDINMETVHAPDYEEKNDVEKNEMEKKPFLINPDDSWMDCSLSEQSDSFIIGKPCNPRNPGVCSGICGSHWQRVCRRFPGKGFICQRKRRTSNRG